ncbi:MAG: glycosyltransferase [Bacteroidales bacterium]|nr:glycosyltransferase [Bacteroidales bacterium]
MEKSQNQNKLAPVCLFTYNRLSETQQTVEALKNNYLAPESELFIFSDGPKGYSGTKKVNEVRQYLKTISGFKSVTITESPTNKGLASSIISGVSDIIKKHGQVIVLEDDLITSKDFLSFMNSALNFYVNRKNVMSISGYSMHLPKLEKCNFDGFLALRPSSWGWATWDDRWESIDWTISDYHVYSRNINKIWSFSKGGMDLPVMLWKQMKGKVDSWAIRFCYNQYKQKKLTLYPAESKVQNIGFNENATHTKAKLKCRDNFTLTPKNKFSFDSNLILDRQIISQFRYHYSYRNKIISRIKNFVAHE